MAGAILTYPALPCSRGRNKTGESELGDRVSGARRDEQGGRGEIRGNHGWNP
jgi:hypothetical protein